MINSEEKSILIISLQGLGNTVIFSPILKYLDSIKKCKIDVVLSDNGSSQYINSLKLSSINQVIIWRTSQRPLTNILNIYLRIRKSKYEIAYSTYPSGKRENILLFLSKARLKKSLKYFKGSFRLLSFLNYTAKKSNPLQHDLENNSILFNIPISEIKEASNNSIQKSELRIGLHIGSKGASKRWDINKWIDLMLKLNDFFKCKFVIISGKDELNLIESIKEKVKWDFEIIVGVEFEVLIDKIGSLSLLIGNDSAIAHISASLNIPTVVVWSFARFLNVYPFGYNNIIIKKNYDCMPCYDFTSNYITDCNYHLRCIKNISVNEVIEIVRVCIDVQKEKRHLISKDFNELPFLSEIFETMGGCLVLSLK